MSLPAPAISLSSNLPVVSGPKTPKSIQNPLYQNLRSLSKSGKLDEAIRLIESSPSKLPDLDTYALLLHSCISQKSLLHGQRLYLYLLLLSKDRHGHNLLQNPTLKSKLITLFSVCGKLEEARRIFEDGMGNESVWVAMAVGYSKNGWFREALLVYVDMLWHYVQPGNFSFSMALKTCAALNDSRVGKAVHAQVIKCGKEPDQVVYNALLTFYTHCGRLDHVMKLFDAMPQRNVVSWNSLIAGFVKHAKIIGALDLFRRMRREGVRFSWITFTIILPICAGLTALRSGKEIHAVILKPVRRPDILVLNALMDMYMKCGEVDYGRRLFDGMESKDSASWNTMLTGCAINGCMEDARKLFDEMVLSGFKPDVVTFVALLSGCSHAGLTEFGQELFYKMETNFGVSPSVEHYACLVDILGRAGRIEQALTIVRNMPMKPSSGIWGSLLNSCRLHGKVSTGEIIAKKLFEVEPSNPGNYVILSNIYANAGMWDSVEMVREMMQTRGVEKDVGYSWIQIKNKIHTFVAGGSFNFRKSSEYKKIWNKLMEAVKENGYIPDTDVVLHNVNKEMKTMWVCGHSERLATVFALIHTTAGMPIRITKNLRVCVDCHAWIKIVSRVTRRLIVLRDTNRFHHFKEGVCSCKDYW